MSPVIAGAIGGCIAYVGWIISPTLTTICTILFVLYVFS